MIQVEFKVRDLLSGIIMMTALRSTFVSQAGANLPISDKTTIFSNDLVWTGIFRGRLAPYKTVIIIFIITMISKYLLDWYLGTKSGYMLQAVGDNETIVTSPGRG